MLSTASPAPARSEWVVWVTVGGASAGTILAALRHVAVGLVLVLLVALVVLAWATSLRWAAFLMLVVAALLDHFNVPLLGINLRPEWVVGVPVLVGVAALMFVRKEQFPAQPADWLLAAWLGLSLISSLVFAPRPGASLRIWIGLTVSAAAFFLIRPLIKGYVEEATRFFLTCGFLVCLFGVVSSVLFPFGFPVGIQINPDTGAPSAYGTLWEADIFGAFAGCLLVLTLGKLLIRAKADWTWFDWSFPVVALLALEASLARMAWLGTLIGAVVLVVIWQIQKRQSQPSGRPGTSRLPALVLAGVLASAGYWITVDVTRAIGHPSIATVGRASGPKPGRVDATPIPGASLEPLPLSSPSAQPRLPFLRRVLTLNPAVLFNDRTVQGRLVQMRLALQDWLQQPFFGRGAGSFGEVYTDSSHHPAWISNVLIRVLHDSGFAGLILFIAFAVNIFMILIRDLRRTHGTASNYAAFLIPSVIVLCLAALATEPFQLMWPWLLLGMIPAIHAAEPKA